MACPHRHVSYHACLLPPTHSQLPRLWFLPKLPFINLLCSWTHGHCSPPLHTTRQALSSSWTTQPTIPVCNRGWTCTHKWPGQDSTQRMGLYLRAPAVRASSEKKCLKDVWWSWNYQTRELRAISGDVCLQSGCGILGQHDWTVVLGLAFCWSEKWTQQSLTTSNTHGPGSWLSTIRNFDVNLKSKGLTSS